MKPRLLDRLRGRPVPAPEAAPADDHASASAAGEVPCVPCAKAREIKQFALDPDVIRITGDTVARPAPGTTDEIGEGEVTVKAPDDGPIHVLNTSAGLVWLSLDGTTTVRQVVEQLADETGADRDVLDRDVRSAIARFVASGIAVLDTTPDPAAAEDDLGPLVSGT